MYKCMVSVTIEVPVTVESHLDAPIKAHDFALTVLGVLRRSQEFTPISEKLRVSNFKVEFK